MHGLALIFAGTQLTKKKKNIAEQIHGSWVVSLWSKWC